jgi:hypothetical protein
VSAGIIFKKKNWAIFSILATQFAKKIIAQILK